MEPLILVFGQKAILDACAAVLRGAGFDIYRTCSSSGEALRTMSGMVNGGMVIAGYHLSDGTAQELAAYLPREFTMMLIATLAEQQYMGEMDTFFLSHPASAEELTASVNMLRQFHRRKHGPRIKRENEKDVIAEAKALLMQKKQYTEEEAHRYLQKTSMDQGRKIGDFALRILTGKET